MAIEKYEASFFHIATTLGFWEGLFFQRAASLKVIQGQDAPEVVDDDMFQQFLDAIFIKQAAVGVNGILHPGKKEHTDQFNFDICPNLPYFLCFFQQRAYNVPNNVLFKV